MSGIDKQQVEGQNRHTPQRTLVLQYGNKVEQTAQPWWLNTSGGATSPRRRYKQTENVRRQIAWGVNQDLTTKPTKHCNATNGTNNLAKLGRTIVQGAQNLLGNLLQISPWHG